MQASEQQPVEVQDVAETEERADLKRAAHRISWKRMNGGIAAANPFAAANPDGVTPEGMGDATSPSRHG